MEVSEQAEVVVQEQASEKEQEQEPSPSPNPSTSPRVLLSCDGEAGLPPAAVLGVDLLADCPDCAGIEELASLGPAAERLLDVEGWYRLLAQEAIHALHARTMEVDRLTATNHRLHEQLRQREGQMGGK
jgi:hypothetical protein